MAGAKDDAELLLGAAIEFAEQMLAQHGELFPYGTSMAPDGKIAAVAVDLGTEQPLSQDVIDSLKRVFRSGATKGEYRATAITYDVRTIPPGSSSKTDAIAVAIDHKDSYSIIVLLPYSLEGGEVKYGETFAQAGADDIFPR